MELLICRNTYDLEFAQHGKNKSNCTHYKNGNCGLDGQLCHIDTYVKKEPSHVSIVMLSRFDEASEKAMSTIKWNDKERRTIVDYVRVQREALASQKISGA
jgi:hypothetical protein